MNTNRKNKILWKRGRSPKLGLDYLKWETNLRIDESWGVDKKDKKFGELTDQAISAIEQFELYYWWKFERVERIDPYEDEYYLKIKKEFGKDYYKEIYRIERENYKEDEEMLIRLIKIRESLWT